MREKYLMGVFGHCPRIDCEKQNLLPIGTSNNLKISRVKVNILNYRFIVQDAKIYSSLKKNVKILMALFLELHFHKFYLKYFIII